VLRFLPGKRIGLFESYLGGKSLPIRSAEIVPPGKSRLRRDHGAGCLLFFYFSMEQAKKSKIFLDLFIFPESVDPIRVARPVAVGL
jgi:hypothetical protein